MEETRLERYQEEKLPATRHEQEFSSEDVRLLKEVISPDLSDSELSFFLRVCKARRLNPIVGQIYAIKRRSGNEKKLTIQTSIDGFRLIAERTGRYAPGREPTFAYDRNGRLQTATSYVKKLVAGEWHECGMTARFEEYCQVYDGKPARLWATMPHVMLAKVSEAACLRRAFPEDLMGLYTEDEMGQADNPAEERRARVERSLQQNERAPSYTAAVVQPTAAVEAIPARDRMAQALAEAIALDLWDQEEIPMERWIDYDLNVRNEEELEADAMALEEVIRYHRAAQASQEAARGQDRTSEMMRCSVCTKGLTKGQYEVSLRAYDKPLCPAHQKEAKNAGSS